MNTPDSSRYVAPGKPRLLDQVREVIRLKHYSSKTETAYIGWIRRFIFFHGKRHPAEMIAEQVAPFLSHLALERQVAASTQNQALSALIFLYHQVLHIDPGEIADAVRAKKPQRLPVALSREEVDSILVLLRSEVWLVCSLLYGAGTQASESRSRVGLAVGFPSRHALRRSPLGRAAPVSLARDGGAGTAWPQGCEHDDDLHSRAEPWRPWGSQPFGSAMTAPIGLSSRQ